MWKYLSRGLRETFERRINFTRRETTGQECNPISTIQNKLIPGIVSTHNFDDGTSTNLGGRCKGGSCKDKKENNREHGTKWNDACGPIQQGTIFGALGWSGVMVLGWYFCQPVCRRKWTKPPELDHLKNQANIARCHTEYVSLFGLLPRMAMAQPLNVLPQKVVRSPSSTPTDHSLLSNPFVNLSVDETDSSDNSELGAYGPITAEQAMDEAADDLAKAQKTVLSEIEHRLGMACMQLGKNKEAVTHFQKAVELDYAPAAFNLGLCYEIGKGTAQDLRLAAKYYELASEWGHATAMYNLGVFYVRGLGGVPVDYNHARQLFITAAELGQSNAKDALALVPDARVKEDITRQKKEEKTDESKQPNHGSVQYNAVDINSPRIRNEHNITKKSDATQKFYELLGIKNADSSDEGVSLNQYIVENKDVTPVTLVY